MRPPAAAPVDAYRNLSRSCFSVRRAGRVIGHVETLVLKDARFVVSAAGVRRVQTRRAREVVAVVRGAPSNPEPSRARRCGFASAPTGSFHAGRRHAGARSRPRPPRRRRLVLGRRPHLKGLQGCEP